MTRQEAIDRLEKLQERLKLRGLFDRECLKDCDAITKAIQALKYMIYVEDDRK